MPNTPIVRAYSPYSRAAVALLGSLISTARRERRLTAREVAERAGISRGLLRRIESGDVNCRVGTTFEVATIVGVPLFATEEATLTRELSQARDKLALLPKSVRKKPQETWDDF